jgi:diaminohydroxyphosphoribosylaminopyrimidine deaminase / 5-amino-6-(5-phosphoribosylamino)uracil reductase
VTVATDEAFMAQALRLAGRALNATHPNPRVGCVIVHGGRVVGEGWHRAVGGPHAEVHALAAAGEAARGATAYVTLEPCCHTGRTPPCTQGLISAGIARVVYAADDPNPRVAGGGARQLAEAGIAVEHGLLAGPARALNRGFYQRMTSGRPFITSKIAASLDGRTALADGRSRWISGPESRADVQRQRARCSAILTGIGTVLADDPRLDLRPQVPAGARQPLRIVLDPALRLPPGARLLACSGEVLVVTTQPGGPRSEALARAGARVERLPAAADGRIALDELAALLGRLELNEILVEAGPTLNGALLTAGLIDELLVYQASHVLGGDARAMFTLAPLAGMEARPEFALKDVRRVGTDLRLRYASKHEGKQS